MTIKDLLEMETFHIVGTATKLFLSGGEYSVHSNGTTEFEMAFPYYVGKDENKAVEVFLKSEKLCGVSIIQLQEKISDVL